MRIFVIAYNLHYTLGKIKLDFAMVNKKHQTLRFADAIFKQNGRM